MTVLVSGVDTTLSKQWTRVSGEHKLPADNSSMKILVPPVTLKAALEQVLVYYHCRKCHYRSWDNRFHIQSWIFFQKYLFINELLHSCNNNNKKRSGMVNSLWELCGTKVHINLTYLK